MSGAPRVTPPLDPAFRPVALANRAFERDVADSGAGEPLALALEREGGRVSRFETRVFGASHARFADTLAYVERVLAFLLWQRGGRRIVVAGPPEVGEGAAAWFGPKGTRRFERELFGERVYRAPLEVHAVRYDDAPAACEPPSRLGGHRGGCRIGFDLGASDRKVAALVDGDVVFQEETVWHPARERDPAYHERELARMLDAAAAHLPRVDAIGGSSAGILVDGEPRVATLFRSVPAERFDRVRSLFRRLAARYGVPFEVANDGDVAALGGSMALERGALLGLALGSSEAAGFVDAAGAVTGWLNELAFAPIDLAPDAPLDDWSGERGTGAQYLSQRAVFRLAERAGLELPPGSTGAPGASDAARLAAAQERLAAGDARAAEIWRTVGTYLGYALLQYTAFYPLECVLLLGRCTSGEGGPLLVERAREVLASELPDRPIDVVLPDETVRRLGQAVAAASLPALG